MKRVILHYGLFSGLASMVLMLATGLIMRKSPDFENGHIYGNIGILLAMLFIFFGVKSYRDREGGGALSFSKAFQIGLVISVISCVFYVITWMIVYKTIWPNFMDQYMAYALNKMRAEGHSEELIRQKTAELDEFTKMYKNPLIMAAFTFIEPLRIGLPVALVSALALKKKA